MSGARDGRAAVFTSSPQDVEIWSAGEWLPGSLLGWRHDTEGGCQVWVRLVAGGAEESVWTDLECLRLPERHAAVAPARQEDPAATRSLRLAAASATGPVRRGRPAVAAVPRPGRPAAPATRGLPAVRDELASRAHHPAGRRRADSRVVGETAEFPAVITVGRHRAPSASGRPPVPAVVPGRHRAADTGVGPAVGDPDAGRPGPQQRAARAWEAQADGTWPGRAPESELLTRPMRLGDLEGVASLPRSRAGR